jgi:hypothetical protein
MRVVLPIIVTFVVAANALAWKIPTPATTEHPGAKEAPTSDPRTYPDPDGFKSRSEIILKGVANNDLQKWRTGYFAGGDPGKYLPGSAMAKLILNPDDADARKYMNDDRSPNEHYHFACVNWSRFLPLFGDVLTDATKRKFAESGAKYGSYLSPSGTENHKLMWVTSANVLPHFMEGGRLSNHPKEAALAKAKQMLKSYVKNLYQAGQGEWDSSTYLMFDVNGFLNIYDFSPDQESRLLAKAALDWYMTGYALKYCDGAFTAPNQRGFADGHVKTIGDQTGWLWWGSRGTLTSDDTRHFLYTLAPITSGWRPNNVICNIALRQLPELPFDARNTKANYWYGQNIEPRPGAYHETLHISKEFTIGTLWNGHGSQITRLMVAVSTDKGAVTITGGNPRTSDHTGAKTGIKFKDGTGRYTQFAQHGPVVISMSNTPDDDKEAAFSYISLPADTKVAETAGWTTLTIGNTVIAVYPLGGNIETVTSEPDKKGETFKYLKIPGHKTGFVLHVLAADGKTKPGIVKVDASKFASNMEVSCTNPDGQLITMKFNPDPAGDAHGNRLAEVTVAGKKVNHSEWTVFASRYVQADKGVLSVNDGREGFLVDFTGDLPTYKPWTK